MDRTKVCNSCRKRKPLSEFCKAADTKDGHQRACKLCARISNALWKKTPQGIAWRRAYQSQPKYRQQQYQRNRKRYANDRLALFTALCGGEPHCQCPGCNVTDLVFLQLDHQENNGGSERRRLKNCGAARIYFLARRDPNRMKKFQVLCANCNHAKGRFNGRCPVHQK